jgi:hypothetical protein
MMGKLILKYLNAIPATAKGHMKRPRHGIWSSQPKPNTRAQVLPIATAPMAPLVLPLVDTLPAYLGPTYRAQLEPNIIAMDDDELIANIFCFCAFANKNSSIVYHDLTGLFPFVSFDGSVCFFVLYHYELNAILITPILGLDNMSVFNAYKSQFDELRAKGFKPKLNITNNQAMRHIKKYLTKNDCKLQVVEPHNHCVNAAERAIQMFKAAFIAALAATDSKFLLQLWDRLTPQVQDTLNMLRASRIDPTVSAYKILSSAYNWNRYSLAPLGCKAVVYKDCNTHGSWAS